MNIFSDLSLTKTSSAQNFDMHLPLNKSTFDVFIKTQAEARTCLSRLYPPWLLCRADQMVPLFGNVISSPSRPQHGLWGPPWCVPLLPLWPLVTYFSCLCSSAVPSAVRVPLALFPAWNAFPPASACHLLPRKKQMLLYQLNLPQPTYIKHNTSLHTYILVAPSLLDFSWQHLFQLRYYQLEWNLKRTDVANC